MDENQHIPESEATTIREFVFAGRKIEAIKLLREMSGLGLAEAKTMVVRRGSVVMRLLKVRNASVDGS